MRNKTLGSNRSNCVTFIRKYNIFAILFTWTILCRPRTFSARGFGVSSFLRSSRHPSKRSLGCNMSTSASATAARNAELTNPPIRHLDKTLLPPGMRPERTRVLTSDGGVQPTRETDDGSAVVVYWMQRDVRTSDNWALVLASRLAQQQKVPLHVIHVLPPPPPSSPSATHENDDDTDDVDVGQPPALIDLPMTQRHANFLLGGLKLVYKELKEHGVPFHIIQAPSHETVGKQVYEVLQTQCQATTVVADFSPIRHYRQWMELQALPILEEKGIPFYQVDAHNIVPVWTASPKREVGARTLRSKINKLIADYLTDIPSWEPEKLVNAKRKTDLTFPKFERKEYEAFMKVSDEVPTPSWAVPGTAAGMDQLEYFCKSSLAKYDALRNDPTQARICSNLSPWINHGHISFQKVARETKKLNQHATGTASFLEEGIIRRELSDNFVYYSPNDYDTLSAAAEWAQETLRVHANDPREYVYSLPEFEQGKTHDDLWNAAQLQLVQEGQMHGFMRMYWAKKILEWTESPAVALRTAQYLNDKYALDGKDCNGFVGVGWSIMGIHDQGWKEREVFGKIRYMNYAGCKRKFKVESFVGRYPLAAKNAAASRQRKPAAQGGSAKGAKQQKTLA